MEGTPDNSSDDDGMQTIVPHEVLSRYLNSLGNTPLNLCDPRFTFRITILKNPVVADAPEQPEDPLDDGAKIYEVAPANHSHICTCFDESDDDDNDNSEPPPLESEDTPNDPNAS
jgi:hypothetical protein